MNFPPGVKDNYGLAVDLFRHCEQHVKSVLSSCEAKHEHLLAKTHSFVFTSKLTLISAIMQQTIKIPL